MPQVTNNLVTKILQFVKEFFFSDRFEFGVIDLTPAANSQYVFVPTKANVLRVWLSLTPTHQPYLDILPEGMSAYEPGLCYVSEVFVVPGGFQFKVTLAGTCQVSWFAIER